MSISPQTSSDTRPCPPLAITGYVWYILEQRYTAPSYRARQQTNMNEKILVVDDDPGILKVVETLLTKAGYQVTTAQNGLDGLRAFYAARPDLVVLDIAMPEMDGITLCRRIREVTEQLPIVMFTALGREEDIVAGLEAGADEYLVKPFKSREFLARIAAILRRQRAWAGGAEQPVTYADEYLTVDLAAHQVMVEGRPVRLTPIEYRLLSVLLQHAGQILTNRQLLEQVWGWEYIDDTDYPRVYIWHLRRKLEPDPSHPRYFLTEPGIGYRFQPAR